MSSLTIVASGLTCEVSYVCLRDISLINPCLISSQSVARLNTQWSNDVVRGPKRPTKESSGYGGRGDLEKTTKYRGEEEDYRRHGHRYGMVFDIPSDRGSGSEKRRKRSRSRERDRDRDSLRRKRSRSRSPGYSSKRHDQVDRDRHRDTERDRDRDRDRDRRFKRH